MNKIKGFTLVEVMVVIAIIGILASFALPSYQNYVNKADMSKVIAVADELSKKAALFYTVNRRWPHETADQLAVLGHNDRTAFAIDGVMSQAFVAARGGKGQVYMYVNGQVFEDDSGWKWLRLHLTDTGGGNIEKTWCDTGGSAATPASAYDYLPC